MSAESDAAVLGYYGREVRGEPCPPRAPLAGLSLNAFRAARDRLARKGLLTRDERRRWVPVRS